MRCRVHDEAAVGDAALEAMALAGELGFSRPDAMLVATATSEIASNAIRYGGGGVCYLRRTENLLGVEVVVEDQGPGIDDFMRSATDGFSTTPASLGLGLGAARRAMDEFSCESNVPRGTRIVMRKYLSAWPGNVETWTASIAADDGGLAATAGVSVGVRGDTLVVGVVDLGAACGNGANEQAIALANQLVAQATRSLAPAAPHNEQRGGVSPRSHGVLRLCRTDLQHRLTGDALAIVSQSAEPSRRKMLRAIVGRNGVAHETPPAAPFDLIVCVGGFDREFPTSTLGAEYSVKEVAEGVLASCRIPGRCATVVAARVFAA